MFIQENIEKLKRDLTDKYVVVSGDRPELRRFEGFTGQVKTVNMSGRALVQFDAWNNIGWYDIDLGYLKVVPKPDPNAAPKAAESRKEAAPKKAAAPAAKQADAPQPAAKPAAGGKMSVAEMLAAARANKPGSAAPAATAAAKPAEAKAKPAPAASAEKKPAKPAAAAGGTALPKGGRATIPQMLAYCREHDAKA